MIEEVSIRPLAAPALLLGIGLGGFLDGIVLHQILQWHSMLSSVVPPDDVAAMKYNMLWDGVFHLAMWVATAIGVVLLFRAARRDDVVWSGRILAGTMLFGWGLFNFVEGIVDHLVLGIHHVHPGAGQLAWDLGFVAIGGVALMLVGVLVGRTEISGDRMSPATRHALGL
jgi:uncharacterized membrane protein